MNIDEKQRIAVVVERAFWGHTTCSHKHALLAQAIIDNVANPPRYWEFSLQALEDISACSAIEKTRAAVLRGEEEGESSTFDVLRNSWAIYFAWEKRSQNEGGRILVIELFDSCDYAIRDEVTRAYFIDLGTNRRDGERTTLDLQSILNEET